MMCMSVVLVTQHAISMRVMYFHLWPFRLYNIFQHYLINDTIFLYKKIIEERTSVLILSTNLSEIFLILRKIQRRIVINVHRSSYKVPVILVIF